MHVPNTLDPETIAYQRRNINWKSLSGKVKARQASKHALCWPASFARYHHRQSDIVRRSSPTLPGRRQRAHHGCSGIWHVAFDFTPFTTSALVLIGHSGCLCRVPRMWVITAMLPQSVHLSSFQASDNGTQAYGRCLCGITVAHIIFTRNQRWAFALLSRCSRVSKEVHPLTCLANRD
jgi:hypothetical protein